MVVVNVNRFDRSYCDYDVNKCVLMCFLLVIFSVLATNENCKDVSQISRIVAQDCTDVNGSRLTALAQEIIK